jgi:hypothetical protein
LWYSSMVKRRLWTTRIFVSKNSSQDTLS